MAKYCTSCGAMIREGSRFCQKCGTPFSEPCPQCGAPVFGTKFCPECGCKLEPLLSVEEPADGIYTEATSNNSAPAKEEPVYRTPRQTGSTSYTTDRSSSPFDVGASSAGSAFSNRPSKKPFYKKWWFWLIAGLVLLGIIGSVAGSGDKVDISNQKDDTSSVAASRKERNGFNKETNKDYEVGGIRYSVPDYFVDGSAEDNMLQFYAETGDEVVMLQLNSHNDISLSSDNVYSGLDEAFDSYLKGMEMNDSKQEGSEKTTLAGLPAKHYRAHGKSDQIEGVNLTVDATFGYDDETHMIHSVLLLQSENPEYSYKNDYKKIVESADKTDNSGGAGDSGSGPVSSSVKDALDSYEAFVDEYVAFMQKYENSNDATSMLQDYMDYLTRYNDLTQKMEKIKEEDLSDADYAYYTEVMLRCSQKMFEAAG